MKALVTGANGFIGANLARTLVNRGWEVHVLVQSELSWRLKSLEHKLTVLKGQVENVAWPEILHDLRPDTIFHLAAYGAYPFLAGQSHQSDSERMVMTNIVGSVRLIEAVRQSSRTWLVVTGSSSEYAPLSRAIKEKDPLRPALPYGATKAFISLFLDTLDFERWTLFRPFAVYGPYEEPTRLVSQCIVDGLAGRNVTLGNPDARRDFIFVEDVVKSLILASTSQKCGVFNLGSGTEYRIIDVATMILNLIADRGYASTYDAPHIDPRIRRPIDFSHWRADTRKLADTFGQSVFVDIDDGLAHTIDWFRNIRSTKGHPYQFE